MKFSPRTLAFLLAVVFALTAGVGSVLAVLCGVSEHCALAAKEEPSGCHEGEPSTPHRDCCELTSFAVPADSAPRLLPPSASGAAYSPFVLADVETFPPATEGEGRRDWPSWASGPPRLALLCTLLI